MPAHLSAAWDFFLHCNHLRKSASRSVTETDPPSKAVALPPTAAPAAPGAPRSPGAPCSRHPVWPLPRGIHAYWAVELCAVQCAFVAAVPRKQPSLICWATRAESTGGGGGGGLIRFPKCLSALAVGKRGVTKRGVRARKVGLVGLWPNLGFVRREMEIDYAHVGSVPGDDRRIEVMANGLPLWGGMQLAVDTTLVSALSSTGAPRRYHSRAVQPCAKPDGPRSAHTRSSFALTRAAGWLSLRLRLAGASARKPWTSCSGWRGRVREVCRVSVASLS